MECKTFWYIACKTAKGHDTGMTSISDSDRRPGDPASRQRLVTLTALLALTAMATGAVGIFFMYHMALQQSRHALAALAGGEARLITAVAQQVRATRSGEAASGELLAQTLAMVSAMPNGNNWPGEMTEVMVLRQDGGKLFRVLLRSRAGATLYDAPGLQLRPEDQHALALAQDAETITMRESDGTRLMAAYEPLPLLDAGVVARLPMRDVIQPLFTATAGSMGVALLLILFGAGLFTQKLNPMLLRIERSEARLRSVLTSAAEGIITIDEDGTIVEFNRAAEDIFGYSAQEAIGQPLELILPPHYRDRHQGFISHYLDGGEPRRLRQRTEFLGARRDGSQFTMELAVSEAWAGGRRLFTGIVNDITARREAEDALYAAKGELERRVTERTAELSRSNRLLQAMHETKNAYFTSESPHVVFDYALHTLCALTDSSAGFLAELSVPGPAPDRLCYLATWNTESDPGAAPDMRRILSHWHAVVEQGEPCVVTDGAPLLLLPLKAAAHVVGIAAVRPGATADVLALARWLEPYLNVCGTLIHQAQLQLAAEQARARLVAAERQLDDIVSHVQDVIFRADMAGTLQWISPSVLALSGRRPEQVLGWNVARHMVEHGIVERLHEALRQGGGTVNNFEARLRHVDGSVHWVSANCHYMLDAEDKPCGFEGVLRDVTAYKEAVQRISELNRLYGVLRETNRAVVDITERERLYQAICRSLTTTGGFLMAWIGELDTSQQRVMPVSYDGFEHGYLHAMRAIAIADPAQGRGPTAQAILGNQTTVVNDIASDPRMEPWRDAALSRGYRSSVALPFRTGGRPAGALMVYAEVTDYFSADVLGLLAILADDISHALDVQGKERERQEATGRLRDLATHLESVREDERAHLAREIHDDLGGLLTAIKMDLAWLKRRSPPADERGSAKLVDMARLADTAIQSMRRIITELRPAILDDLGLIPAVEWQLSEFGKRTGIKIELHLGEEPDVSGITFPSSIAVAAFRTLQEALTNTLKHAGARHVVVHAMVDEADFVLKISDDGRGMEPEQLRKHGSYGVLGMRERAHALHGRLDIHSMPHKGLTVVLRLPLRERARQDEVMQ